VGGEAVPESMGDELNAGPLGRLMQAFHALWAIGNLSVRRSSWTLVASSLRSVNR
jgi:hypothetical protein